MYRVQLASHDDFEGWRKAARDLSIAGIESSDIVWQVGTANQDLLATETLPTPSSAEGVSVPQAFLNLAERAILHSDSERFALLYALLQELRRQPGLLEDRATPLLRRVEGMAKAVNRDIHKMRAFVRFREIQDDAGSRFVAWFEPEHHIVRENAGFFVRRFASMHWSILTPELSIHWDGHMLTEGPGASRGDAPSGDPVEDIWKSYYASIFNPARLKVGAMLSEMPRKYWRNLPEASLIPELVAGAQARETAMMAEPARPTIRDRNSKAAWLAIREDAMQCTRCHLYKDTTQTVFGEGPLDATIVFVGEQPGDQEDLAGRPFVGPAGQLFDRALQEAGIDRAHTYVTNAVKHFKHERRGKRRIHQTPETPEIQACRWWLTQEVELLRPTIIVALGATAARSLLGKAVTISKVRGQPIALDDGTEAWVTVHPSFLLRIPDEERKAAERVRFIHELKEIGERIADRHG